MVLQLQDLTHYIEWSSPYQLQSHRLTELMTQQGQEEEQV